MSISRRDFVQGVATTIGAASLGILPKTLSAAENPANGKPAPVVGGERYLPYEKRTGAESDVWFTRELSVDGLRKIFAKVGGALKGKVGVKLHTGEKNGPNIIPSDWVRQLVARDLPQLKDRIVMLGDTVDDQISSCICAQLLFLEAQDPEKEICLYINSPGGSVTAGLAIYDTMRFIACPVATVCLGMAASMGAFLLAAGTIVRVKQAVIGCFRSYFFLFIAVNSGDRLGLLFRGDSR